LIFGSVNDSFKDLMIVNNSSLISNFFKSSFW
jgi:hypothetical protein